MRVLFILLLFLFSLASDTLSAQASLLRKAEKQYQLHDYKDAIDSYERFLDRNRNATNAKGKLADCYRHLNELERAADWYEQAVRQTDVDAEFLFQYGLTLKGLGKYSEARQLFLEYAKTNSTKGIHFAESCTQAMQKRNSATSFKVRNESINTDASDFAPAFYRDKVIFSSFRKDIGNNKRDDVNYAYIARPDQNNYLTYPELLHPRMKTGNEGPFSYVNDGSQVAVTRNNFKNGVRQIPSSGVNLNIQIGEPLPSGDWQHEKYFMYNGPNFSTGYPAFSPDGKTLFFASNRPDGFGGFDLFVTYRIGNTWTTPENLGPNINTQGDEISPFFDGENLYFSSNWHHGMGGFDVFRAVKNGGRWSQIYHLDTQINSPRDDYGFIYDDTRNLGYLVSNRQGGKGKEDIYQITKSSDNFEIVVLDGTSYQPLAGASIDFSSCGQPIFTTDINGSHVLQIPQGLQCQAVIRKAGYQDNYLDISQLQMQGTQRIQVTLSRGGGSSPATNPNTDPNIPVAGGFPGTIYDFSSGKGVGGVYIKAVNQNTTQILETRTDEFGRYSLSLQPYSNYVITYSLPGYTNVSRSVNTGSGQNRQILGEYPIRSTSSGSVTDNSGSSGGSTGGTTGPTTPTPDFSSGYSVQVAAFRTSRLSDLNRYKSLENIGNVYNRYEGNKTKVRVGVFSTRAEAVAASKTIKAKGFKDCFVVSESLEGLGNEVVLADGDPKGNGSNTVNIGEKYSNYKVRLASYQNPANFQESKVSAFGLVERKTKGPWTIMLLYGYASVAEAQRAAQRAKSVGFYQAHVVVDNGVELKKVQ